MIAAILGTVFAILFSFSIFTVQHAAGNYAPGLLQEFRDDRNTRRALFFFIGAIALNLVLVFANSFRLVGVLLSFGATLWCLVLIKKQYNHTINLIDPLHW